MKKKPPITIFNFGFTVLFTLVKARIGFMRRDAAEFVKFGITAEKVDALNDLTDAWSDIPTDEEFLGTQEDATQAKNNAAALLRDAITAIMARVINKYGEESGTHRKFGASVISALDMGKLSYVAKRVHRVATGLLTDLAGEGLTAEILADLKTKTEIYDLALAAQEDAFADRDIATENRIEKANEIYLILVKYCDTGKTIWEGTNEAKYNDYVIYDTPSGTDEGDAKTATEG